MWVYSRGLPFTYPSWWIQPCGWSTCGCSAVFPRLKGRTNSSLLSILPVWQFGGVDFKSICSTEYDYSWAMQLVETVIFPCLIIFLSQGSLNSSRVERLQQTADQACFRTSQLCLWENNQIQKYLNLKHLKQSETWTILSTNSVLLPHRTLILVSLGVKDAVCASLYGMWIFDHTSSS
jgi:hypothetical protein